MEFKNNATVINCDKLEINFNQEYLFVLFSKDNCKYCDLCKEEWDELNLSTFNVSKITINVSIPDWNYVANQLKFNKKLLSRRENITFPTFIIYKKSEESSKDYKYLCEYSGLRDSKSWISWISVITSKETRISDKITSIFPVKNNTLYDLYKKAKACFWDVSELDLSKDKMEWHSCLNKDEQFFLENILAFFAQSDQIVNINLEERFMQDVETLPEDISIYTKLFYNFQKMMEDIHSITYETLLDTYITDKEKSKHLKNAINLVPAIKKKAQWATKWIDSKDASFGTRLIAFAVLEGVFFSGSFCAIFWIREKGILNGLTKSNEFISRDEGMHYNFALTLYNILKEREGYDVKCNENIIIDILKEAVEIEKEFITSSFNCRLVGMNSEQMTTYIEYVADFMLSNLGIKKVYNSKNPFLFMENIGLLNKTNFFEQRVSDYKKSNSSENANTQLSLDDDF
jgi:ribonucleotide reductase beta subunit family protein with ferritin-like domain